MKFGIIGPRDFNGKIYTNALYVGKVLTQYRTRYNFTEIISGGGRGVETLVEDWCKNESMPFNLVMPNIKMHDTKDAFIYRNNRILSECDILMLFWDGQNQSAVSVLPSAMDSHKPAYIIPMV